uniref:Fungal lipase-like domain-containing protein n=1 Tax=Globodera rostochiensis TaxID=31243 RepID=A0A914H9I4_GLORO
MSSGRHRAIVLGILLFQICLFSPITSNTIRLKRQFVQQTQQFGQFQQQYQVPSPLNVQPIQPQNVPQQIQPINGQPNPAQNPVQNIVPKAKLTKYNEQYAKIMLALSAGAYGRSARSAEECVANWMPDASVWRIYASINHTCDILDNPCSSYTVVSEARREMVIVFRGTKTKEQLFMEGWQSIRPGKDFYGAGKVNKYFFHALSVLWPKVHAALTDANHNNFQVTFTGHSLGGALASLAAMRTVLEGIRKNDQIKLYTFGQPRVGNVEFAFKHDELIPESFRVVFRMDIVAHMPPCAKNEHYDGVDQKDDSKPCDPSASNGIAYHHGTEIWYPNGMDPGDPYFECVGSPRDEDFHCSDSLSFEMSKYSTYISDHRHYFGHKVPAFGKLGCPPNSRGMEALLPSEPKEEKSAGLFQRWAQKVKTLGRILRSVF